MSGLKTWSVGDAAELYRLDGWSRGYFGINDRGHLEAYPARDRARPIDLLHLVRDAQQRGLALPLLVRFSDILRDRIAMLAGCFEAAITEAGYGGTYHCVYPVKVNPQRQVVDEVVRFGAHARIGLEAGSKPELHAVLAMADNSQGVIVCNGFKDHAFVRLALRAQALGRPIFLVVEKPGEVGLILRVAEEEGVQARLGMRIKLAARGAGKWEDSGGDASKFGLTATELVGALEQLARAGRKDWLHLLHFHLGSQISELAAIQAGMREIGRYYAELRGAGWPIHYLDVGGGLGVDYNASHSTEGFSVNYDESAYARTVVGSVAAVCAAEGLPHPHLITEAGRSLTAHQSMLVINVLERTTLEVSGREGPPGWPPDSEAARLGAALAAVADRDGSDGWTRAKGVREEAQLAFEGGTVTLAERAELERSFWRVARRLERRLRRAGTAPAVVGELQTLLADKYFCNFSVFQSLPDSWAIHQRFPVAPLHRLNERPRRRGVLQDITCDSDGKIASYIGPPDARGALPLHVPREGEPYYLGVFLTGAYQEILGELHNLFGDPNVVHVAMNEDGSWHYEQLVHGESVSQVLGYVQFRREVLLERIDLQVRAAVEAGRMTSRQGRDFQTLYDQSLDGMPYLSARGRKHARPSRTTVAG